MSAPASGWSRDEMAAKAAALLEDGEFVNLGIGIPTRSADFLLGRPILLHTENGLLGVGRHPAGGDEDADVVNAGKEAVTAVPGASFFDSALSFAMIRGGHIDVAVLGAMQVSASGDLANWNAGNGLVRGIGGAMDLALGAKRVIAVMVLRDRRGSLKLVRECTLPVTAVGTVDTVVTEVGVFDIADGQFWIKELAPGVDLPSDVLELVAPAVAPS
jgi:3-oxoacid CoA-transferase subunit B